MKSGQGFGLRTVMLLVASCCVVAGSETRPNILLILGDDIGREVLGAYGGGSYSTPSIDALAETGMRFDLCYSTPMCSPTRVELLTGRYSFRNYKRWRELDPKELTFAQLLRGAGYRTAHAGKWQFEGYGRRPQYIRQSGFDEYLSNDEVRQLELEKRNLGNVFWNPVLWRNGLPERANNVYSPELLTDFLVEFMTRRGERPFLAYYCMNLLHRPFMPTADSGVIREGGAAAIRRHMGKRGELRYFPELVAYADRMAGKLIAALEDAGLREDTLVIFTADNGTDNVQEASNLRSAWRGRLTPGGKYLVSDLGVHVPFIANWPGRVPAGRVYNEPIDFTDVLPTLSEVARAPVPETVQLDGKSFAPQLYGKRGNPREWVYSWGGFTHTSRKYKDPRACRKDHIHVIRDKRWKLYSDGRLFDMIRDPFEERPIAEGNENVRQRLATALHRLRSTGERRW